MAYAVAGGLQGLAAAVAVFGFTETGRRWLYRPRHAAR